MTKSKSQDKFEAAVELKLLNPKQVDAIKLEQQKSNRPPFEIAIRKGYLNRNQIEVLNVFSDPTAIVPGYRIDGFLGQGGSGTVYKATQIRMDRPVAIKTINRAVVRDDLTPKRFEREAKIVGRLRHPNIISAFDFGIHGEQLYLVMEFADGIDADQYLADEKKIPEFHAWHIAQQVCQALDNAIQHGIVHRDIKPGNIILTNAPAGTQFPTNIPFVKVADFGLAKFNDQQLDATLTLEHAVNGTPFYMSPEQIKAEDIDHRSDIYSLGTTIWHLITGEPPVTGTGPLDVITRKMKLEDTWLSESPSTISDTGFQLLKKMCRHDRNERIDDYKSLISEIKSVIQQFDQESFSETKEYKRVSAPFSVAAKISSISQRAKTLIVPGEMTSDEPKKDYGSGETANFKKQARQPDRDESAGSPVGISAVRLLVIAVAAILLPLAIFFFWPKNIEPQSPEFTQLVDFAGPPMFQFDGINLDPTQKKSGTWEPAKGAEGEWILSGIGTRNFRCQDNDRNQLRNFQFVCGFRHNASETIGFRLLDESENPLWEVNVKPEIAILKIGERSSSCSVQQFNDEKHFGYNQFRMEAQPNHWRIEIDNELLGVIPKPKGDPYRETTVQLYVDGPGVGHFEQIQFRSFKDNEADN